MQKLAEVCIRRPVFATMIIMALVVVGAVSYFRLGVDRFPSVELPTVSVRTELPGASPEEMETQVSQKLEEAINTIQGIHELRSITSPGNSIVIVTFNLNRPIDVAAQDIREKVAIAVRNLPRDIRPPIISKFDNDQAPVLTLAVSGNRSLRELTEIADKTVKVDIERASGVGEVRLVGGLSRAVNVWVDANRLAAYQIPIASVRDAIARQNADLPGGNVTTGRSEQSLRTMGRIVDPRSFNDLVVATVNGAPIRVRDIGAAEDGTKEQRSAARINGVPSVVLEVRRQSGENTVAVIEAVKANLARLAPRLPADVQDRDHPRSVELHLQRPARDQPASGAGQHPGLPGGAALHAEPALDHHRGGGHPVLGHFRLRHDVGARVHPQQRDHARPRAHGRHRHRRRHRGAREHLPVRGREEDAALRGGPGSHRRYRAGRHGHHLLAGGDLRARVVHVVHLGTLPLPVRPHGGRLGPGEPPRVLHPDPHDERAHAARRGRQRPRAWRKHGLGVASTG